MAVKVAMGKGAEATNGTAASVEGDSKFARALASSDYHTRAKGWHALQVWLQGKQQLKLEEVLKIWKGILFCFWHSDKAHVQQELAIQLAHIMLSLRFEVALVYLEGFLVTMAREWPSIDKLRLDKFMMLVRHFIHTGFSMLQEHKWDSKLTLQLSHKLLVRSFIAEDAASPIGFGLHLADLYISELQRCCEKEGAEKITHDAALTLLQPFVVTLQRSQQPTLITRIKVRVFEEFATMLEDTESGEQQPYSFIKRKRLGEVLFASGALAQVRGRNRQVLYELAELFDRKRKSKKRSWEGSAPLQSAEAAMTPAQVPSEKAGATPKATSVNASTGQHSVNVSVSESQPSSGGEALKKKKQNKQRVPVRVAPEETLAAEQQPSGASAPEKLDSSACLAQTMQMTPAAKKAARKKAAGSGPMSPGSKQVAAANQIASDSAGSSGSDRSSSASPAPHTDAKLKKRRKKRKGLQGGEAVPGDGPRGSGNVNSVSMGDGRGKRESLTRDESKALTNAVDMAVKRCQQKRISFNLSKNLVHEIGKPLPPAELRTPPSAKPSGSALKKASTVGNKSGAVARKLVFF